MLHTIQADFYRLFRSKGFWISEFFLIFIKYYFWCFFWRYRARWYPASTKSKNYLDWF